MLVDQGVTHEIPRALVLPDTVQALLAARIDLLSSADKAAFQAGAVIGRSFRADPVRELMGHEPRLDVLGDRGFVWSSNGDFTFTHALTRDVAYASLTTSRRARLHAEYADWLERAGEERDDDAAELAYHYAEAVRPEDVDLAWPDDEDEVVAPAPASAVAWLRRASNLAIGATRCRTRSTCWSARLSWSRTPAHEPRSGRRSRTRTRSTSTARLSRRRWRRRSRSPTRCKRSPTLRGARVPDHGPGRHVGHGAAIRPRARLDRAALELAAPDTAARAKALIARCYADYDKSAEDAGERRARSPIGSAIRLCAHAATTCATWSHSSTATTARRSSGVAVASRSSTSWPMPDTAVRRLRVRDQSRRCVR